MEYESSDNHASYHVAELTADGEQEDFVNHDKKLLLDQLWLSMPAIK